MAQRLFPALDSPTGAATQHKAQLQDYFDGIGFERWAAIYGEVPLSRVRRTIRTGHDRMLAQAAAWLAEHYPQPAAAKQTLLDAGCGTGLFSVAMARRGFYVTAVDIAPRMVAAAQEAGERAGVAEQMAFYVGDVEGVIRSQLSPAATPYFNAVVCFDVLVHYPAAAFSGLCTQLSRLTTGPFLFTYAPYSRPLAFLHWLGGRFPQGQRRTEIQMIREQTVTDALAAAGLRIRRTQSISHGFYHVMLLEAGKDD